MAYTDLTPQEQADLDGYLLLVRPAIGSAVKLLAAAKLAQTKYAMDVAAIVAQLVDADDIPNKTGLADAKGLTKAEVVEIAASLDSLLTTFDTDAKRQLHIKAAGINAIIQ